MLAIIFGLERFHQYTYGPPVTVQTDHKPLEIIFTKSLQKAPKRLQKMLLPTMTPQLQRLKETIAKVWPETKDVLSQELYSHFDCRDELLLQDDIILREKELFFQRIIRET
ncbi:hypothetical protein HOLleu_37145 [Holothuria leucospilota]|uniref:Reverse transcriptase RNase H-like domain-containing protein n=1 Tax=Holothuria leucospilota TaxID=206669 RepID=A0A9Q0YNP9_HOLLE|nr:hypothetical protein HOLleu_37145 [Holothuria leucospilota]